MSIKEQLQQPGRSKKITGADIMNLERFADDTRHMIVFDVLPDNWDYLTFSIEADSIKMAKSQLARIETDILNFYKVLSALRLSVWLFDLYPFQWRRSPVDRGDTFSSSIPGL